MHLLFVCQKPPLLPVDGNAIATRSMILGLLDAGVSVDVLAIETDRHPAMVDVASELADAVDFDTIRVDTEVTIARAIRGLFSECYNVERFDSPSFRRLLERRLSNKSFDAVVLDSLYAAPYLSTIRSLTAAPVILRAHNVEHQVWGRLAENSGGIRGRYLAFLARRMGQYEAKIASEVDAVAAIAEPDRQVFLTMPDVAPVRVVDVGMEPPPVVSPSDVTRPLCSLAAYDWLPNTEAMQWFLESVWPLVRQADPEARLDIAGRDSHRLASEFERPGVRVLGLVPSAADFLQERGVVIVPTRSGSGVRIKIVEAMLLGKPIVTTAVGAQGATDRASGEVSIADTPAEFAQAVVGLLSDQQAADALGAAARRGAVQRHSRSAVTEQLTELVQQLSTQAGPVRQGHR